MKLYKYLYAFNLLVIAFLIVVVGCTVSNTSTDIVSREAISYVGTIPATRVLTDQTPFPTTVSQTPTPIPNDTSTASMMPLPTSTPTIQPTVTESPTPTATLTDTELRQFALDLLEDNNSCQLPCWWGITPGETNWDTAYKLIRIFDRVPNRVIVDSENVIYMPVIPLPSDIFEYDEVAHSYSVQNGIVERIEMPVWRGDPLDGYLTQYTLPVFLTTYGSPVEVWLSTYFAAGEGGILPFSVVLFYPEQGIVALYSSNGEKQGDFVQGCPQEDPVSYLVLTSPDINQTFKQAVGVSSAFNMDYLSLEEATGMDVATFYETFKNPDNTTCLETPANLWR
jgi:hypothetical protein